MRGSLKTIHYGTTISPSTSKNIICRFEPKLDAQITSKRFDLPILKGNMPSISAILTVSSNLHALKLWQHKMINTMGMAGFRKWMTGRVTSGTKYHSAMEMLVLEAYEGRLTSSDESILSRVDVRAQSYVRSSLPILRSLHLNKEISPLLEMNLSHPLLGYRGRFDAAIALEEGLTLIDWKTSSAGSSISNSLEKDSFTSDSLYSYPSQMAAYVGAFNASQQFNQYPQITRALIVIASETGKEANVVEIKGDELEKYWNEWKGRVAKFWSYINSCDDREEDTVDVRY